MTAVAVASAANATAMNALLATVFSAGIPVNAPRAEAVRALLAFMTSPDAAEAKRRQGMSPA